MWPSGGYLQYLSTWSVSYIHVSNPPTIVSSCWVPDFHAATRWCLPAVSQYFVSVPYSREQSSCQCWRFPSKEWNIIRNVWENCVHVIAIMSWKLDVNRKSLTQRIESFVFLFLELNQILNPFQQLHPLHYERPFSMGMVHCVGGCIQLPLQLLYFPFPTPIIEGAIGINRNGNKQKTKAKKGNKKKDQNKFLNKDKKEKINVSTPVFTL